MVLAPFLIYALATLVLTALTAYPVFLGLEALGLRDMPFDQMVMRLLKLYALLGLWPLLSGFGINTRSAWGYGPGRTGRSFSRGLVLGAVIGIASMALVVLVLLALEIRVVRPGIELTPPLVTAVVLQSAFAGLMVGFIEETWFRGALQTSITHVSNSAFAIVFISMVYGAMHFISADIKSTFRPKRWDGSAAPRCCSRLCTAFATRPFSTRCSLWSLGGCFSVSYVTARVASPSASGFTRAGSWWSRCFARRLIPISRLQGRS